MGEIVGYGMVSHVPPIVLSEEDRRELNGGPDLSLVDGLHRMKTQVFDRLKPDTVIVLDTHWITLMHHIFDARAERRGVFTAEEILTNPGMQSVPFDLPGDPELCKAVAEVAAGRGDTWVVAADEPNLPMSYGTVNLLGFLQGDENWVRIGTCQTAQPADWAILGEMIGEAVAQLDRRVVLLGSGSLSHRFWPMAELRQHESASLEHIRTPEARAADEAIIAAWERGDHAAVIDGVDTFMQYAPEGHFGHYLGLIGAIGGRDCVAPGVRYSEYESSAGTGQLHIWFEKPEKGWTDD